jgi:hypothetical protein
MAKLYELTELSWIIQAGDENIGILFKQDDGYLLLGTRIKNKYKDLEEIAKKYGSVQFVKRKVTNSTSTINGYPVKHPNITKVCENPPIYIKEGGKTEYVAGYWGLEFMNGWTATFCPKVSTIQSYEAVGPFKNRLEMLNHLSTLNTNNQLRKQNEK